MWGHQLEIAKGHTTARVEGREETVLSTAQILRGKLERAQRHPARDVYDIDKAAGVDPISLEIAVNTMRHDLVAKAAPVAYGKIGNEAHQRLVGLAPGEERRHYEIGKTGARPASCNDRSERSKSRRTMGMGEIRVSVTLENSDDRAMVYRGHGLETEVRRTTIEGIVDTGAVSLVIPEEVVTELGLRHTGTRTVVYADERREERPIAGPVMIEIGNLATRTDCIVGAPESELLIGQIVLEALDLIADCTNQTVTPRHPEGPVLALR